MFLLLFTYLFLDFYSRVFSKNTHLGWDSGSLKHLCDSNFSLGLQHLLKSKRSSESRRLRYNHYIGSVQRLCRDYTTPSDILEDNEVKFDRNTLILLGFYCPEVEEIEPCTCSSIDNGILDCSRVGSFIALQEILNNATFPSPQFTEFLYSPEEPNFINESILFNNIFGPLTFEKIVIKNSGLMEVEPYAFYGSRKYLQAITLDANEKLRVFPFHMFTNYTKLQFLEILDSEIDSIPVIGNNPSLNVLSMASNKIQRVRHDAFANLPALKIVDLSLNKMEKIGQSGLYLPTSDILIYLGNNQIRDISPFMGNQPVILEESANSLTTFNQEVYQLSSLLQCGITHIICIRQSNEAHIIKPAFPDNFLYLTIDMDDTPVQNIIPLIWRCRDFIDDCLSGGGKCLVHSCLGISRSPSVIIAYVMGKKSLSFKEALQFVKERRFCINPNDHFLKQLSEYEAIYKAEQTALQGQCSQANGKLKRKFETDSSEIS